MQEYKRTTPDFSLCGLNCVLCPRHNTDGSSRCPGCGGPEFNLKHPSCAVIRCSRKNGNVEYCFVCEKYPCERFSRIDEDGKDSFISYRNVLADNDMAKSDLKIYLRDLEKKNKYLEYFLTTHNDGRSKGFFCLAINLLGINDLDEIIGIVKEKEKHQKLEPDTVKGLFNERARARGIELVLRR
jgi:hypothetical protein